MVVFWGEGKPEYPEKTSRCREENQQTQPTYDARSGNRTRDKLLGGECSHQCAIPAPLKYLFICTTCTTNKSTRHRGDDEQMKLGGSSREKNRQSIDNPHQLSFARPGDTEATREDKGTTSTVSKKNKKKKHLHRVAQNRDQCRSVGKVH